LLQICESVGGYGDTGITGNATLLRQFLSHINIGVAEVRSQMLKVDRSWKSDDYNYADFGIATIPLVASQFDYSIPIAASGNNVATLLRVNHIYYTIGAERIYLDVMDRRNQNNATATGTPCAYYFDGKSILFDIAPNAAFISSAPNVYVDFSRLDDPYVTTNLTHHPGFLATYHHILAYKAIALDKLMSNPNISLRLSSGDMKNPGMFESGIIQLQDDVSRMSGDLRSVIKPKLTPHI
jgi:hypothetical protein